MKKDKNYIVEMLTDQQYHDYYSGSNAIIFTKKEVITAESPQQAIELAELMFPDLNIINKNFVQTVEEAEAEKEALIRERKEAERKEEERRKKATETRKQNELKKAQAAGMTVEEYKKEQSRQRSIKRLENEIAQLKKELAKKERQLKEKKRG
jgi:septal ring factor EnvC (AmiA/AmiB activator)